MVCSTRFADPMKNGMRAASFFVFEDYSRAPNYEDVAGFKEKSLSFLRRYVG